MAYLIGEKTAKWIQRQMRGDGVDLRTRRRITRWAEEFADNTSTAVRVENLGNGDFRLIARLRNGLVFRNGAAIPMSVYMPSAGNEPRYANWYEIATFSSGAAWSVKIICVTVNPQGTPTDPEWAANKIASGSEWEMALFLPDAVNNIPGPACVLPVGTVTNSDGVFRCDLFSDGPWCVDWIMTDEESSAIVNDEGEDPWPVSLTRKDGTRDDSAPFGTLGLYDFHDPDPLSIPTGESDEWPDELENDTFVLRHWNETNNRFEIAYMPIGLVCKGDGDGTPASPSEWEYFTPPGPDADCDPVDANPDHLYVWDSCRQQWVPITVGGQGGAGLDSRYWRQGGNESNCWGQAIGDANATKVIDLANRLLNGDWGTDSQFFVGTYLTVQDDATITGNATIGGDAGIAGNAGITGNATVGGDMAVTGDMGATGAATVGSLTVNGSTNAQDITTTGIAIGGSTLTLQTAQIMTDQGLKTIKYLGLAPT